MLSGVHSLQKQEQYIHNKTGIGIFTFMGKHKPGNPSLAFTKLGKTGWKVHYNSDVTPALGQKDTLHQLGQLGGNCSTVADSTHYGLQSRACPLPSKRRLIRESTQKLPVCF